MATVLSNVSTLSSPWLLTIADVRAALPEIADDRICLDPPPGQATEADLLAMQSRHGIVCELLGGTLVRKAMGGTASSLAIELAFYLRLYLGEHPIGALAGESGFVRLVMNQVRAPDLAFYRWESLPNRSLRGIAIFPVAPALAVEILSPGNSDREMSEKLKLYFEHGVQLVWLIDPREEKVRTYTSSLDVVEIDRQGTLSGGEVLPEFSLKLSELFDSLEAP